MALQFSNLQHAAWWWLLVAVGSLVGIKFTKTRYYEKLRKPSFAPPPWVFGVVWPVLYILQAEASYFVQRELGSFGWQCWFYIAFLIVSTLWTFFFFVLRLRTLSLGVIVVSFVMSMLVAVFYCDVYWLSGLFVLPTVVWLAFACLLNWKINYLNPRDSSVKREYEERATEVLEKEDLNPDFYFDNPKSQD